MKRFAIAFTVCCAAPLAAQDAPVARSDRQLMADILSLDPGRQPFAETLPLYIDLFRQNDLDGEPGYSMRDRQLYLEAWEAKIISDRMQAFFVEDLNGDLVVTVEELRVSRVEDAHRQLRRGRSDPAPTPEAVDAFVAEKTQSYLDILDLDGDGAVSFDEARVKAREIGRHARDTTVPVPRMAPSLAHDTDGDGTISEAEFVALARAVHGAYDQNGDGVLDPPERELAHQIRRNPPSFMGSGVTTAAREIEGPTCLFPRGDEALSYYVIGGFEGAAMTNLRFEDPNEAVELVKINVPEDGPDIRVIAAFQTGTILDFDDPDGRVKVVYDTRGPIGVSGASRARLVQTDPACHLELWNPVSPANPDPRQFFGTILRRAPEGVIADYTLGMIDLGTLANENGARYPDSIDIDLGSAASDLWVHFVRFNPGGLVTKNPGFVRFRGTMTSHTVFPQYAGLARLVEEGVLTLLPRSGRIDGVRGSRKSVSINGTTYRTGGGDDAIRADGLIYRYEREGTWTGRAGLTFRIEDTFLFPAGLTGAHAVTFILPPDVGEPIGDRGQSVIERAPANTIIDEN